jgi:hypothetical protein
MNEAPSGEKKDEWLQIASDAFVASTTYMEANYRKTFEKNIALFQSRHPSGSKYNSAVYKSRSRLFRPKTKSVVRKNEAAAAAAFFANVDVVTIEPQDDANRDQVVSAALMNEVVNYRLTDKKSIPWFLTVMGAVQEAQVIGVVCSYQYWHYRERQNLLGIDADTGEKVYAPEIIVDKPCIQLLPVENYRFDPAADWTDVVNSSPYFIRMVPMYVDDVKQRMKEDDGKTGQSKWKRLDDGEIRQAMVDYDSIRQAREQKQDPKAESENPLKEFEIVWCHENFIRLNGEEKVFWTLGTQHMLSDPVDLKQAYFHGERPFVIGCAVIEAHKAVPDSLVGIGSELQKNANEVTNQRLDNVSLVLNKRYIVKRGAQVDTDSLLRNAPAGITLANDPEHDIVPMDFQDVTASSYQEMDRINVDYDELTGNFSQSSVQTNRKLNETVGGMEMAAGGAGQMTEYLLRTIVETWMEGAIDQLVKLEQAYETDMVILGLAGSRAKLTQKYGVDQVTDSMLNQSLTVRVSIGMGATDPAKKLGRFLGALKAGGEAMQILPNGDSEAIWNEIMGLAGYKGGSRFFQPSGPNQQLMAQLQEMQKELQDTQGKLMKATGDAMKAQMGQTAAQLDVQAAKMQVQQAQMEKGAVQVTSQIKEQILAGQQTPDIKPALDAIKVTADKQMLEVQKRNALLEIENRELKSVIAIDKAEHAVESHFMQERQGITEQKHGVEMQKKDVESKQKDTTHAIDKDKVERQAGEKVNKAETTAHDAKQANKPEKESEVVKHVKELKEIVTAPKELVRDANGKVTHVKQGDKLTPVKRDENGKIVGL